MNISKRLTRLNAYAERKHFVQLLNYACSPIFAHLSQVSQKHLRSTGDGVKIGKCGGGGQTPWYAQTTMEKKSAAIVFWAVGYIISKRASRIFVGGRWLQ